MALKEAAVAEALVGAPWHPPPYLNASFILDEVQHSLSRTPDGVESPPHQSG